MKSKAALNRIIETLKERYPDSLCSLQYEKDYELLFAYRGDCGEFERAWAESLETPLSRIGRISAPASASEAGGLVVVRSGGGREIFRGSGFDHMA